MNRRALLAGSASSLLVAPAWAQQSCFDRMDCFGGSPSGRPSLDLQLTLGVLDSRITYTGGNGTYFDATGTMQAAVTNVARFDHSPVSPFAALGLLIEESRTNSIRNSTMVGAVAGTPGTLPTNWAVATPAGLTTNVIGFGSSGGIPYVDLQITGTPNASAYALSSEVVGQVPASSGQSWAVLGYFALVGGTLTNVTSIAHRVRSYVSSGATPVEASAGTPFTPTGALTRQSEAVTLVNATSALVVNQVLLTLTPSSAINLTLRIGAPQLELGAFATSFIPTSTVAVTRAADVATMPVGSWFNAAAGTFDAEITLEGMMANGRFLGFGTNAASPLFAASLGAAVNSFDGTNTLATANTIAAGTLLKMADAWGGGAGRIVLNAGTVASGTFTGFGSPTTLYLMQDAGVGVREASGWLRRVRYWPRALGAGELQADTT